MGLFTNPVTFTVNAVARIFNWRGQIADKRGESLIGEWYEPAATLAQNSTLTAKHRVRGKRVQSALLRKVNLPILDGSLQPVTITFSAVFHTEHTVEQQDGELELMALAVSPQSFRDAFSQRTVAP
jgi:hypothetical protein